MGTGKPTSMQTDKPRGRYADVLGGFVIRPVRLGEGETIIRVHQAYRRFVFGTIDIPGELCLTSKRLVWTTLWLVKQIRLRNTQEVTLHRKWGFGLPHWSLRVKSPASTDFFRFRPMLDGMGNTWNSRRQKEEAHRWVELVKHWANL